jgi:crossover junction endodeoxyribonuclease RuvC
LKSREKNNQSNLGESIILGIDPGSINCGYGLIKTLQKKRSTFNARNSLNLDCVYITSGTISLSPKTPLYLRLKRLYDDLIKIIRKFEPGELVIENMFFAKSVKAALSLGHARATAMLAAASEEIKVYEYTALEVKKAVTGYGSAEKSQVQEMVIRILNLTSHPDFNRANKISEDSTDALALALCHMNTIKLKKLLRA